MVPEAAAASDDAIVGYCRSWNEEKGFGFVAADDVATHGRAQIFVHRSSIKDGNCLMPNGKITYHAVDNDRKPGEKKAARVTGGVCRAHLTGECRRGSNCKWSHARVVTRGEEAVAEADSALAALEHCSSIRKTVLVDTEEACREHCGRMIEAGGAVAVDFEGVKLSRHGALCLAQLAAETGPVVLVDVEKLGEACFGTGRLKELLESPSLLKLIYDGRADADALFHLHGVRLTHVCDCQVLFAYHTDGPMAPADSGGAGGGGEGGGGRLRLGSLKRALEACGRIPADEAAALVRLKEAVVSRFDPNHGGSYEVWRDRPLDAALVAYAGADVAHLHTLRVAWGEMLAPESMAAITEARISKAIDEGLTGKDMVWRDFA